MPSMGPFSRLQWFVAGLLFAASLLSAADGADQPAQNAGAATAVDPDHAAKLARGLQLFQKDIRGLLLKHCVDCHGGKETHGGLNLATREGLLKGGEHGPAVVPGRGERSLLTRLVSRAQEPYMPQDGEPLSKEQIARLATWIDLGAPYDAPLLAADAGPSWTERKIDPQQRQFWSFRPLAHVPPPDVADAAWCRTPLDRFIRAAQEQAGVAPNPTADRAVLIRRAYFDVLGLPPSPADIEAFLHDPAPDAYERLVERLLADAHYGERWGRHWLDLARFAESHGFEHDYDRPTAFHYRDFVVQALNANMPYDQFVHWQLAGDEFAPDDRLALMATGFLAAGVHSTQITKNEVERHRYDEMDDMLATTGTTFLGLTLGCARCHDHKYDPVPQGDYYRLLASFTKTIRSEVELDFDPVGYAQAKAEFEQAHAPFVAAVAEYERTVLPQKFSAWRNRRDAQAERPAWIQPRQTSVQSQAGTTFALQADGSYLAQGANGAHDVYTVAVETSLPQIAAIRIEALTDPSLQKGGPGRAGNGNFALSTFSAEVRLKSAAADAAPQPLKFSSAAATFEQVGLPIAAALDDNPASAWAVDPQFGRSHAAVFRLAEPLATGGGAALTLTLKFQCNTQHNIGRLRVSCSERADAPVASDLPFRETILALLSRPEAERTAAETAELLNWYKPQDAGWKELDDRRAAHAATAPKPRVQKVLVASEGLPPVKLHTQAEQEFLPATHYLRRGDPNLKEAEAQPAFLQALVAPGKSFESWKPVPPPGARTTFQRAALARWLTDPDGGAGALTARVIVNRLWQHALGRGLVATPSDFGARGEPPTHPELLDWLAGELIRRDWDVKSIQRLILLSSTYRQTGAVDPARLQADRQNRLWWHRPRHRLEAEAIRDAVLSVSGLLDDRLYGPGQLDERLRRRSLYFTVKRSQLVPMMTVFDAPDGTVSIGERPQTTIAPQALMLMNGALAREAAAHFAQRLLSSDGDEAARVRSAYLAVTQRPPSAAEIDDALQFLQEQSAARDAQRSEQGRAAAWTDFCQVLLCLNEFVYVD